jgi:hypothetical protein
MYESLATPFNISIKKNEVLGNLYHHNTNITLRTLLKQNIAIFRLKITKTVGFLHNSIERGCSTSQNKNLVEFG